MDAQTRLLQAVAVAASTADILADQCGAVASQYPAFSREAIVANDLLSKAAYILDELHRLEQRAKDRLAAEPAPSAPVRVPERLRPHWIETMLTMQNEDMHARIVQEENR